MIAEIIGAIAIALFGNRGTEIGQAIAPGPIATPIKRDTTMTRTYEGPTTPEPTPGQPTAPPAQTPQENPAGYGLANVPMDTTPIDAEHRPYFLGPEWKFSGSFWYNPSTYGTSSANRDSFGNWAVVWGDGTYSYYPIDGPAVTFNNLNDLLATEQAWAKSHGPYPWLP